jgi:hypothetical protein
MFSIEEASQQMGNNPIVNVEHYGGTIDPKRLLAKVQQHPSNNLVACFAGVSEQVDNQKEGEGKVVSSGI